MVFEFIEDTVTLTLAVACLYVAFTVYVRRIQPAWIVPLEGRRLAVLGGMVLVVFAIKVSEDVIGGDSGPIDHAVLTYIHNRGLASSVRFFEWVTLTGSSKVLTPVAVASVVAFLLAKRRFEAFLSAASTITGAAVVYIAKALIGRARPTLWETQEYWGSSFPSGHTLVVAAFACAVALGVGNVWPVARLTAFVLALLWILLVAFSRLVLGVHWPTDVLAAACIGVCIPLVMALAYDFRRA